MWGFLAGFALPAVASYPFVAHGDRRAARGAATFCFRACLSFGLGMGAAAGAYFLWLFFVGPPGAGYCLCESAVFAAAGCGGGAWLMQRTRRRAAGRDAADQPNPVPDRETDSTGTSWRRSVAAAFVAGLVLAGLTSIGRYWNEPIGDWDAWSQWNQRARFFVRGGADWRQAFGPEFPHVDYPLLLPCANARLWTHLGAERAWSPWLLGSLLMFCAVGVLTAAVCRLKGRSQGLLAGLTLLGTVAFVRQGANQYADAPVAFFMLSSVAAWVLCHSSPRRPRGLLVLSGLLAGMAAWTKNEGLLFAAVLPAAGCAIAWKSDGLRKIWAELAWWLAGAAPLLAVLLIQKTQIEGKNDLLSGQNWQATLTCLADASRYWCVAEAFVVQAARCAGPLAVVLPLMFVLLGVSRERPPRVRGATTALAVVLAMLAGYGLACLTTPYEIAWQVDAAKRLVVHLWPIGLLAAFLALASPEELSADRPVDRP